jgi:hypothetical protein
MPSYPKAALVFAAAAVELAIKGALLQPIVSGLVHTEALAPFFMDLLTQQTGAARFNKLLFEILNKFGGVSLRDFKRVGSVKTLWEERTEVQDARNALLHRGENVNDALAVLGIAVASTLLQDIFPSVLAKMDLHVHDPGIVCSIKHAAPLRVMFTLATGLTSRTFPFLIEVDPEHLDLKNMPETFGAKLHCRLEDVDSVAMRSGALTMSLMTDTLQPERYHVEFEPYSVAFTASKTHD